MKNGLKLIQSTISKVLKTAEYCFDDIFITTVVSEYSNEEYNLEANFKLFNYYELYSESCDCSAKVCSDDFLENIDSSISNIIEELEIDEGELVSEEVNGEIIYKISPQPNLSSAIMFRRLIRTYMS